MVLIGHASIDEQGAASGGAGGDQTGKELCTRQWYNKGWNVLLRPATAELAEKSAAACEAACGNPNIGYDQMGRNTLYEQAKTVHFDLGAIHVPCECDCSALMHVCAVAGGAEIPFTGNCATTRTMVREFTNSGEYIKLTGREYLTTDENLLRGDILVKEGSHTVMVLGEGAAAPVTPAPVKSCTVTLPVAEKDSCGDAIKAMQQLLLAKGYELPRYGADGEYGAETENALLLFQEDMNLAPDGICGTGTWSALLGLTGVG